MGEAEVVLDVRTAEAFSRGHARGSFSFPWETIGTLSGLLPPRERSIVVVVDEYCNTSAIAAFFERLGYRHVRCTSMDFMTDISTEDSRGFCWEPNPFLRAQIDHVESITGIGLALDVGTGAGRDAAFLGDRGWLVIGIDNREVLCRKANALAKHCQLLHHTLNICCDVGNGHGYPVVRESIDFVNVCRFIHRESFAALCLTLRPGGVLLYSHFLDGCQDTPVGHPKDARGFFRINELEEMLESNHFTLIARQRSCLPDGRPMIHIVAQKHGVDFQRVSA